MKKQLRLIRQEAFESIMNCASDLTGFANDLEALNKHFESDRYRSLANYLEEFIHRERRLTNA